MDIKAGYKTTEFWLTLGAQIVALLVTFNAISPDEAQTVNEALPQVVASVATIITAVVALVKYIQSRTEIKTA